MEARLHGRVRFPGGWYIPPSMSSAPEPAPRTEAPPDRRPALRVVLWLVPFAILGAVLVRLYPDSYQQDGGYHFLFARWSLEHPPLLVDVWGRPLFTALYALPARLGYPAAKLLTVAVACAAAWHTAMLARAHGLERAELAVPLLFLQPSFLLLSSETMTEPLFALVLALALRVHQAGRLRASTWTASLLPLVRPEGFFVALLWGAFVALDRRAGPSLLRRALSTAPLAAGVAAWWLAALVITRDPLFILHNWPPNWAVSAGDGTGPLLQYWLHRDQLLSGRAMQALFALGVVVLLATRRALLPLAALLLVTALHSVFYRLGLFGSLGYPRYLVCVAPPMALATLAGWDAVAAWTRRVPRLVMGAVAAVVLLLAARASLVHVDGQGTSRDARAVDEMFAWLEAHPRPVTRFVFSQAYMSIRSGRDPAERPRFGSDRERNLELLRAMPSGTLVLWDARTGPLFRHLAAADIERAGYERLHAERFRLPALFPALHPSPPPPYEQELVLLYKP